MTPRTDLIAASQVDTVVILLPAITWLEVFASCFTQLVRTQPSLLLRRFLGEREPVERKAFQELARRQALAARFL